MHDELNQQTPTLLIHIGVEKTGSTSIQRFLFHNRDFLESFGYRYANTHYAADTHINSVNHHILRHLWPGWLRPDAFPTMPEDAWNILAEDVLSYQGTTIISSERFPDLLARSEGPEVLDYIKRRVAPARVRVVGFARRQDILADSHFKELIKGNNLTGSLGDYLAEPPPFFDFFNMFEQISNVLGRDNVAAKLYDPYLFPQSNVINGFLDFLPLCLKDTQNISPLRENPSFNALAAAVFSDSRVTKYHKHPDLNMVVREFLNTEQFERYNGYSLFNNMQRNDLMERYKDSNVKFADNYLTPAEADRLLNSFEPQKQFIKLDDLVLTVDDVVGLITRWIGESDTALAERNRAITEKDEMARERDRAYAERDKLAAKHKRLTRRRRPTSPSPTRQA